MTRYRNRGEKKDSNYVVGDISSFFQTHCEFFFLNMEKTRCPFSKFLIFFRIVEGDMGAGTWEDKGGSGWEAGGDGAGCGSHARAESGRKIRDIMFFNDFLVSYLTKVSKYRTEGY